MACNSCNENNSIPLPIGVTDPCNPCETPCTDCNSCECTCADPGYLNDGCYATQITDCTTYNGDDLACVNINKDDLLTSVIQKLVLYTKNTRTRLTSDSLSITEVDDSCDDKATIELVPSTDSNNILELGTDGLPYVPAPDLTGIGASPAFAPVDSTSIDFTASGTLGHTPTAVVRLNPTNNLITVGADGLLVDSTTVSPVLTFNNGLARTSNTIKLGGPLLADTTLVLDSFDLNITGTVTGVSSTTTFTNAGFTNGSYDSVSDSYSLLSNQYDLFVAEIKKLGVNPSAYYALGQIAIDAGAVKIGHYFPTVNGVGSAPADDKFKTSYLKLTEGKIETYSSTFNYLAEANTQTTGAIISSRRYKILNNSGGADFTPSGAANNTVGTIFNSNGTTPTWGTGSLELLGAFNVDSKESTFTGQVLVRATGTGGTPTLAAQLEVQSTTKGSIPFPKMTATQRGALTPVDGLAVYQTDATNGVYVYDGTAATWKKLTWA